MIIHEEGRIESLRRENFLKGRLLKKGFKDANDMLLNLKVNVERNESFKDVWKKTIGAIKRNIAKLQIDESFIESISFGRNKITIDNLEIEDDVIVILRDFAKKPVSYNEVSHLLISGGDLPESGYSLLQGTIPPTKHKRKWRLSRGPKNVFYMVLDFPTLAADVFLRNAVWEFAIHNPDHIRRHLIRSIVDARLQNNFCSVLVADDESGIRLLKEMDDLVSGISRKNGSTVAECSVYELVPKEVCSALYGNSDGWDAIDRHESFLLRQFLYRTALVPFLRELKMLQYESDAREESFATHARVWQLKKNIPLKTQEAMKTSVFLEKYSAVEYDADVDLQKIRSIEKEFERFCSTFPVPKSTGSFRVRKLGNYRASGLYFPFHQATCVDIDGASSYGHELLHQIDYTYLPDGRLSETLEFRRVYDLYERSVCLAVNVLPKDDPFRSRWYGKTKYNEDYYLQETEVFARCGELYLHEVMGVRTSLLDESYDNPVYPKDEQLLKAIKEYYEQILPLTIQTDQSEPHESSGATQDVSQERMEAQYPDDLFVVQEEDNQLAFNF
ncbi:hypothetical protein [Paenibacillus sp. GXUN7292]|uniref:hypothetical protein n=1 Tax=Paenibacillus sp. GXUN7292 TaxID=3422499 RepID=UPI003D7D5BB4